jgi:hypothetical protein
MLCGCARFELRITNNSHPRLETLQCGASNSIRGIEDL